MAKYGLLNAFMGGPADFNDKIKNGRSLKYFRRYDEKIAHTIRQELALIPYVTNVFFGPGYIRVYVENR
jgi:hypothetical protein